MATNKKKIKQYIKSVKGLIVPFSAFLIATLTVVALVITVALKWRYM